MREKKETWTFSLLPVSLIVYLKLMPRKTKSSEPGTCYVDARQHFFSSNELSNRRGASLQVKNLSCIEFFFG